MLRQLRISGQHASRSSHAHANMSLMKRWTAAPVQEHLGDHFAVGAVMYYEAAAHGGEVHLELVVLDNNWAQKALLMITPPNHVDQAGMNVTARKIVLRDNGAEVNGGIYLINLWPLQFVLEDAFVAEARNKGIGLFGVYYIPGMRATRQPEAGNVSIIVRRVRARSLNATKGTLGHMHGSPPPANLCTMPCHSAAIRFSSSYFFVIGHHIVPASNNADFGVLSGMQDREWNVTLENITVPSAFCSAKFSSRVKGLAGDYTGLCVGGVSTFTEFRGPQTTFAYRDMARPVPFASHSARRALLIPQVNPGSCYRCGRST